MLRPLLFAALAVTLAACTQTPGTARLSAGQTVDIAAAGAQVSVQRARNGIVRPLVHSAALQAAANAHAEELNRTGAFGHTGRNGSTPRTRARAAGMRACLTAENIARGQPNIRSVVSEWMDSPGHRSNLLNAQVTQFGFARSGNTWVMVLARPC